MLETALPTVLIFVGGPILVWWLRRTRRAGVPGTLKVVSRTALTRNGVVAVVESDGRRFLVGATDHGISLLTELEESASPRDDATTDTDEPIQVPPAPVAGPGMSPLDVLREMTVRKPIRTRNPHGRVRP